VQKIVHIIKNIKPENFFLVFAFVICIASNLITPPLQAPDEHDHFRRAYHIADGHFLPERSGDRLGGQIPVSFIEFAHPYRLAATNLKYTLDEQKYFESFKVKLRPWETSFADFPNTSLYSPISYFPQSLTIFILKDLEISDAKLYYTARIVTYLFWMLVMYFLIRNIPVCKWLFTFLVLLPMNLYISNSFSADTMTNVLALSFVVLCLKYAFDEKKFGAKQLAILIAVGMLLALAKVVYVGLVLAFFVIPSAQFLHKRHKLIYGGIILLVCFLTAFIWAAIAKSYMIGYAAYDPVFRDTSCLSHCANYEAQKEYILSHGSYFFGVIWESLFRHPYTYLAGYTGSFGNNDIPLPRRLFLAIYIVLIIVALTEKNKRSLSAIQKAVLIFASFASFILLLLSQHLSWDCVGEGIVDVVQGRYLIPLFPALFFALSNSFSKIKVNVNLVMCAILLYSNIYALNCFYDRYIRPTFISEVEWKCDMESVNEKRQLITSNDSITLLGVDSRNDSTSHSGVYSAKLSPASPYCFTYVFKGLERGDLIEMSAWQKGEHAEMIVTGTRKRGKKFYITHYGNSYKGEDGWNKMHFAFTINEKMSAADSAEVNFFIWNPTKKETYIDDVKFSVKKFGYNYIDNRNTIF
jgi:uncharacterized membrane protein